MGNGKKRLNPRLHNIVVSNKALSEQVVDILRLEWVEGKSLREMGKETGIKSSKISKLMHGSTIPSGKDIDAICKSYGLKLGRE